MVAQGQGIAVDFELADKLSALLLAVFQLASQPFIPGLQFFRVESVIKAEQSNAVLHAAEACCRCSTDPLGWAVGGNQLRIALLELQQFPVEAVIDRVFHLGCIQDVVGVGRLVQQLAQLPCACQGSGIGQGRHGRGFSYSQGRSVQPASCHPPW